MFKWSRKLLIGVFLAIVVSPAARAEIQFAGAVQATTVGHDQADFAIEGGAIARVQFLDAKIVRIRFNPTGTFTKGTSGAISLSPELKPPGSTITDLPDATYFVNSSTEVIVYKNPFHIAILRADGSIVSKDMNTAFVWDSSAGTVINLKFAPKDEYYFGLGLPGGPVNRRGRSFYMMNQDAGAYQEFSSPLYSTTPFFYGVRGGQAYGLFLDNPAIPIFDLDAEQNGTLAFGALHGDLDYYVMTGPGTQDVANLYAKLTGFMPLPPKWTLGYHQSRFGYRSQSEYLDLANTFRAQSIPADALYFDLFNLDHLQTLTWDPVNFPSPEDMNSTLDSMGFNRVVNIGPVVRTDDTRWTNLSASAFFLTNGAGQTLVNNIFYGDVSWFDFTKPSTRAWYSDAIKTYLQTGISGVWNDLNEPAQNSMSEAMYDFGGDPRTDQQARNIYALQEVSLNYQAQQELRPNIRPWILSRSGYPGIQRYAANWSGDNTSTFDALRVNLEMSLSMGLSGQNQFGHDVGGFLGSPSPELFIRWLEFGSLTPFFRNHALDGTIPREPWSFGEPYTDMSRNIINRRYQWLPYIYSLFDMASRTAQPVLAPAVFYFPSDPRTYSESYEYMLGPELLVAPVFVEGATTRTLYLPAGCNWIDLYTDHLYAGGQEITVNAPLEQIPIFVREGTVIPGGPVMQYASDSVPSLLSADVYPGPSSTFRLYEDDGISLDYQSGAYLHTVLNQAQDSSGASLTITRDDGSWQPPSRPWWLRFHGVTSEPSAVQVSGTSLPVVSDEAQLNDVTQGWFYRAADNLVIVRIADSAAALKVSVLN
jgi:alpha-glucosidase